jgi:hypothetical protein
LNWLTEEMRSNLKVQTKLKRISGCSNLNLI